MLYHGSKHQITDEITPHVSFDGIPLVYATDDYRYALIRAGNFNPDKFMLKEDYSGIGEPIRLIELYPGAFLDAFDCEGHIYMIESDTFTMNVQNEYISKQPVKIKEQQTIRNIWYVIKNHYTQFELIYYEDSEPYWKTVRGGRAGYLKRREERASALKKAQPKMKKTFHFDELIKDFKDSFFYKCWIGNTYGRLIFWCLLYLLIGTAVVTETGSPAAMPLWPLLIWIAADLLITTFLKYYH